MAQVIFPNNKPDESEKSKEQQMLIISDIIHDNKKKIYI